MGVRRTLTVLLVGVVVVVASGFATAPGGMGGPTMSVTDGDRPLGGGAFGDGRTDINPEERFDGPDDTMRAKFRPANDDAAARVRQNVSVHHELGDTLTADVTRAQYDTLDSDSSIDAAPVQQVSLAQRGTSISWEGPRDGETVSGTTEIRIDVDAYYDYADRVTWSVDGGSQRSTDRMPWSSMYGARWDTTDLADGTHELTAHVRMESGETESRSIQVTVDNGDGGEGSNDPPSVSWSQPAAGTSISGDVPLAIEASDSDGSVADVQWRVDGGSTQSASASGSGIWEATWDASSADAGTYELTAIVTDDDGATSQATRSVDVAQDGGGSTEGPSVNWQSPTDGDQVDGQTSLSIAASDSEGSVAEVRWRVDGGSTQTASSTGSGTWEATWDASNVDAGTHDLTAIAVDDDGATSQTSITVDVADGGGSTEGPSVNWQSPTDGDQVDGQTSLAIAANDPDGSVEAVRWRVDGGLEQQATYDSGADAWTATWDAATAGGGTHQLTATAVDDSGTVSTTTISVDVADRNAAPTVSWRSPSGGSRVEGETSLSIAASDPEGSVEEVRWRVDDGSTRTASATDSGTWETTWDASSADAGTHNLTAVAVDDQGVQRETSISVEVLAPEQPPSVTWESPTDGQTVDGTLPIEVSASDADGSIQRVMWRVEGTSAREATQNGDLWTDELNASGVTSGEYTLTAAAIDDEGLVGNSSITVSVDSQNRDPTISWHSPHEDETLEGTVQLQIQASDPEDSIANVQWGVADSKSPTAATYDEASGYWEATLDASDLSSGTHTLQTRVTDEQGGTDTATVDVEVDPSNGAPSVGWASPTDGDTVSGEVDLRVEATDPDDNLDVVRWTVDNETPFEPSQVGSSDEWSDTLDTTELSDGEHVLRAGAQDAGGAHTFEKIEITVDNQAGDGTPSVSWNWPEDGAVLAPHEVPIEIDASVEGGSIAAVRWQVDRGSPRTTSYNQNAGRWEATWDAGQASSGTHELRTRIQTEDGKTASASVQVTVTDGGQGAGEPTAQPDSPVPYGVERIYAGPSGGGDVTPSGGDDVDVAVLDSGIDVDHPDLQNSFTRCLDVAETGSCQDQHGHGTHVAGLVAADGSGGLSGVAPQANLHAYKVVDAQGAGHADDVAAAIHDAAANDVEVLVLSVTTEARGSLVQQAIAEHSDDLLVVAAAGNGGPETGTVAPPAASPEAVAVGALDSQGQVVESSARGITADSFCECADRLELVAAGQDVESTWRDGGYNTLSGTSVAAPQVAGVAAKAWASGQADLNGDGTVTPAEVRQGIRQLAVDIQRGSQAGEGYDAASGVGMPTLP